MATHGDLHRGPWIVSRNPCGDHDQSGLGWLDLCEGITPSLLMVQRAGPPNPQQLARSMTCWHGAINSRGQFYSSESPADITNAFSSILGAVTDTGGSAAGLASNSTSIQPNNTSVYQAKVDSTVWMGKLLLLPVLAGGSIGNARGNCGT